MIAQAPWAFAILTVVIIGVVWAVINHLKANQIGNFESRLRLRDDEIADYKRKLEGASPDEAAARIAALEAVVAKMGPRKISLEQRQLMLPYLRPFAGCEINIAQDAGASEAAQLLKGLVDAFTQAGWSPQTSFVMGPNRHPRTGLGVIVLDPANLSAPQRAVTAAIEAVGMDFEIWQGEPRSHHPMDQSPLPVAEIVLTARLED